MALSDEDQQRISAIFGSTIGGKVRGGFGAFRTAALANEFAKLKGQRKDSVKKSKAKDHLDDSEPT